MAFKLTAKELTRKGTLVTELRTAFEAVELAQSTYNEKVKEADAFREEIKDRLQEEYDDKGDNWQEKSTKAEGAQDMINQWEGEFEELELDDAELPADQLEGMTDEAE